MNRTNSGDDQVMRLSVWIHVFGKGNPFKPPFTGSKDAESSAIEIARASEAYPESRAS
jgi:hypothetical protein